MGTPQINALNALRDTTTRKWINVMRVRFSVCRERGQQSSQ
jgi:hypothetical protein